MFASVSFVVSAMILSCMPAVCLCVSRGRENMWVWTLWEFIKVFLSSGCVYPSNISFPFLHFFHFLVTFSICPARLLSPSVTQSPTRAVLLKMAVQRSGEPPRPGSACVLKRSPLVEAELCEARSSSACSYSAPLPNKLAGKVNQRGNKILSCRQVSLLTGSVLFVDQERAYRSPEKRSSLPRPAKSLTRHIPAAEQEDNSTPCRPTCKITLICLPLKSIYRSWNKRPC